MADKQQRIIRKALDARHQVSFTVKRATAAGEDENSRTIDIICATNKPITHFLWSRWQYVDIELVMDKKAMRAERFEAGAAFLMDHNTRDQRGVIDSFEIKDGELRATVRMSRSERGEELYQDILDGIRQQISLGFMIHNLTLVEERKDEPDRYEARDWEPYEASSVAVAADLDAKVMRAIAARRDGMETCPDCEEPIDECNCSPDENTNSTARKQRAINPQKELKMGKENEGAGNDPVVETRSREEQIMDFAGIFGDEGREIARDMIAASGSVTIDDVRSKIKEHRAAANKTPQPPVEQPQDAAKRQNPGVELARTLPRHGQITAFRGENAAEQAYRFGNWLLGRALYDGSFGPCVQARKFCEEHGIVRAMGESTNEGGGALVPIEFSNTLIDLREMYGVFRRNAKIEAMSSDTKLIPRRTGGLTAYFVAEAGSITASDAAWDNVELVTKKLAVLARYSSEISLDSTIDFANTMAEEISYAFAQKEDDCGFNGDGSSTYGGITGVRSKFTSLGATIANIAGLVVATGTGYASSYGSTVLTDFEAVVGKLPIYADTPRTKWYCHKGYFWNVMQKLALAAGGNTESQISNGSAPRFLGYDVEFVQVMPQIPAVSQVCALLGDLSLGARMGTRLDTSIAFSEHSRFANDQIEIRGTERFDINVHDVGNYHATAASRVPGPIVGLITAAS